MSVDRILSVVDYYFVTLFILPWFSFSEMLDQEPRSGVERAGLMTRVNHPVWLECSSCWIPSFYSLGVVLRLLEVMDPAWSGASAAVSRILVFQLYPAEIVEDTPDAGTKLIV